MSVRRDETKKTARLEARIPPAIHALLQRAASLQGRTMSDFVVAAARDAAEIAIAQHGEIQLSMEEQRRFAKALLNPPPVAPALKRAAELHRELTEPS